MDFHRVLSTRQTERGRSSAGSSKVPSSMHRRTTAKPEVQGALTDIEVPSLDVFHNVGAVFGLVPALLAAESALGGALKGTGGGVYVNFLVVPQTLRVGEGL